MKLKQIITIAISLISISLLTTSCGDSKEVRKYKESAPAPVAKTKSPHGQMSPSAMPPGGVMPGHGGGHSGHFAWDKPEGWTEEKATRGMRLATFTVTSGDASAKCTIIPLQGDAGGLKANVSRWLGQVTSGGGHMDPMMAEGDASTVDKILQKQDKFLTKGNFPAVFIDYTPYTAKPADNSILVTLVTLDTSTVFIKMTGPQSLLKENIAKFKSLSQSFRMGTPPQKVEKTETAAGK